MLRVPALTPAQQRALRHWQVDHDPRLARHAQVVLWSARGWSVPALAHVLGCRRRTVRRWVHALLDAGLIGLLGRAADPQKSQRGPTGESALVPSPPATDDRLVPVVPLSVPELRRILEFHWCSHPVDPDFFWHWSIWRR
jgi:Homeodomain-like domain